MYEYNLERQQVVREKVRDSELTCVTNNLISKSQLSYLKNNAYLDGLC